MKKILFSLVVFFLFFNSSFASYKYFYGNGCPHCLKVERFMEKNDIEDKIDIEKKEVYNSPENRYLFIETAENIGININELGVPFLVSDDGKEYFFGDKDIIDFLKGEIAQKQDDKVDKDDIIGENNSSVAGESKGFWSFILILLPAALSDSINPCVFAVMLILLGSIMSKFNSTRKMVFSGLSFILAIFISYFLMGLGIYKAISSATNIFYIKAGVGVLGLLVGLANLKDYFWYGKGFLMEVPLNWRPKLQKIIKNITSPLGAFIIGFIVSLFLLPCTSGPYFTILGYLASESNTINTMGYIYLFIYNIIFILPMFFIIFIVAFGKKSIGELKEYKEYYSREIHLVVGILMILLASYIFYDLLYI
ncbi:hypothetical protein CSB08_00455 [Candidatus Gracilibacteria bacterium]|nr:MAG: hypothetical protein CSB08_00455 [Candidatus Gracilibacteria bacterium]PIE85313.1 MAG: hypothetical protein CSA08_02805 [Candidatus Gracilibacteria bacterium]